MFCSIALDMKKKLPIPSTKRGKFIYEEILQASYKGQLWGVDRSTK